MRDQVKVYCWVLRVQLSLIPWRVRRRTMIILWRYVVHPAWFIMTEKVNKMITNGQAFPQDFITKVPGSPYIDEDRYSGINRHAR